MAIQRWSDDIWVVELAKEPAFSEDMLTLISNIEGADRVPNVVLDLSRLLHINSSNLSQLIRLRKLMNQADAGLRLAGVRDEVWSIFLATAIDKIFDFNEDLPTALASLQMDE